MQLVVKFRDDDKNYPHCPLQHEGYCHLPQMHYRKDNALYMIECLGTINKRPPWCPLKEEKEAITIEWINEHSDDYFISGIEQFHLSEMLNAWEKENGRSE